MKALIKFHEEAIDELKELFPQATIGDVVRKSLSLFVFIYKEMKYNNFTQLTLEDNYGNYKTMKNFKKDISL